MKHKDWFIASGFVALGIVLLTVASIAMRPMGMGMSMVMIWGMFVPWLIPIILFLFVLCFSGWAVSTVTHMLNRRECPSCGRRVRHSWKNCPNCGSSLNEPKRESGTRNPK